MCLDIFPEERLIGKVEFLRNLFDRLVRVFQPVFDMFDSTFVDQIQRGSATCVLNDLRQVFGAVKKRIGKIGH